MVYGFEREGIDIPKELPFSVNLLGRISSGHYKERLEVYFKSLKGLSKRFDDKDTVYYLFGLDIAMVFLFLNRNVRYIYDECDLTHTYLGRGKSLLEALDRRIIRRSSLTVTTSEGFIQYHFNKRWPDNVILVENKLDKSVFEFRALPARSLGEKLNIGFVGFPRFNSVFNFIRVYCSCFQNFDFHIFGGPIQDDFNCLRQYPNCHFHGSFQNPQDLPEIYSSIDLVLCTYDTEYDNVRFAEPNKLYESIFFETPIIVSSGTFLADKVRRLGIGYDIDALDDGAVVRFINTLSQESIMAKKVILHSIEKKCAVTDDRELIRRVCDLSGGVMK
jgi:glycosyltransferase involved in cell wall biosynthesis